MQDFNRPAFIEGVPPSQQVGLHKIQPFYNELQNAAYLLNGKQRPFMPPLNEHLQSHQQRAVSSMNLSSQSFKIASSTATSSQSGRSPIVGTTLGKFILAAKGKSNIRQLAGLKGAPSQYYDSTKIEDYELMKDVQSWIEENSSRCNPPKPKLSQGGERHLLKQYSKRAMAFPLNFLDPEDEEVPRGVPEDNIFFQGFKAGQKNDLQSAVNSQGGPRRNVRLIHHNIPSQISKELSQSSSSVPSRKGQRNTSAIPQRESNSVIRNNNGLNDGNLFLHGGLDDSPFKLHPSRRHEQLLDRILRASQNGGQIIKGTQNRPNKEAHHYDQLKTPESRQTFDPWLGLEVRCMGPMKPAPDSLQVISKSDEKKTKGQHQGFHIKRNNAAIYIHMNEQKLQTQDLQAKELKLIGNQCQSKVSPEVIINNLQLRKSSQDNLEARELLLFLQRRYHELPSKKDFDGRLNSIKQRMDGRSKQVYSERDRSTVDDDKWDDSVEELDPCVSITKLEQSHSRQPPVCIDNQERVYATQVQQSQSRHKKLLSVISKKTQDPDSQRGSETQQKPLYKLNLINQKPKKLAPKPKGEIAQIAVTPDTVQTLTDQQENIRKAQVKLQRPIKKITPLFANASLNQSSWIESDEERIERMHRFQKEIKAKYNDISMTMNNAVKEEPYKYVIIRGNNSELVKRCLDERAGDWQEIQSTNTLFHFKWSPFSKGIKFDYLTGHGQKKMVNHFEAHEQMTEKDNLYLNLSRYCETKRKNVFSIHPVTFVLDFSQQSSFNEIERFQAFFNILEKNKDGGDRVVSVNKEIASNHILSFQRQKSTNKYQVCENMFDGKNFWLIKPTDFNRGRGVQVFNTLEQFRKLIIEYQQGVEVKFHAQTGCASDRGPKIKSPDIAAQVIKKITVNISTQQGPQVAPPDQVLSNFSNLDGVLNIVKTDAFVVQKYLERPLLINNRKFDIRLWVLMTQENKVFLFKEGYIRTSSFAFDISPESIDKPFIHLTNNAVQRFNDSYGAFEEGNQLSYQQAQALLKADGKDCDIYSIVNGPVLDIILDTIKSVETKINQNNRKYCMELFGYDFILDQDMKPWLIEVNTNPCLEESSGLLKILLPRMLDDALKLTVDLVFPPKRAKQNLVLQEPPELQIASEPGHGFKEEDGYKCDDKEIGGKSSASLKQTVIQEAPKDSQKTRYHVDGHSDSENMWGLIYQLKV